MKKTKNLKSLFFSSLFVSLFIFWGVISNASAAEPSLKIPLGVSDGAGGQKILYFGQDGWATAALDPSLGEASYPPMPPAGVFDARFNLPNGIDDVIVDYRHAGYNYNGTFTHQLQYQPGDGQKITIYWNFPSGISGRLQDLYTGSLVNVLMSGKGSYTIDNPSVFNKLKMTVSYGIGSQAPVMPTIDFGNSLTSSSTISVASSTTSSVGGYPVVAVREPAFKHFVTVSSGFNSQKLYFGLDFSATNGLDRFLGEETWPPMPPIGAFDARFNLPGGTDDTIVDYRPGSTNYNSSQGYVLNFQPNESGRINISWDFPDKIKGSLNDLVTGNLINVLMTGRGSYDVTEPSVYNHLIMKINYNFSGVAAQSASSSLSSYLTPSSTPSTLIITPVLSTSSTPVIYQQPENKVVTNVVPINNKIPVIQTASGTAPVLSLGTSTTVTKNIDNKQASTSVKAHISSQKQLEKRDLKLEKEAIKEFVDAYKRLPASSQDWNVIHSAAYSDLEITNSSVADTISQLFLKIFGTQPNSANSDDQEALAYLSGNKVPSSRNLKTETRALKSFISILKRLPKNNQDWNIVRALAYSRKTN